MKKLKLKLAVILFLIPFMSFGQKIDCAGKWDIKSIPPYEESSLTEIAACKTGKKYEFIVLLSVGKEYNISFYASSSFSNEMNFIIEDLNSGSEVLNLPGKNEATFNEKGTAVLEPYYVEQKNRYIHPYFVFSPENATNIKIIIDVLDLPGQEDVTVNKKIKTGCIKVLIFEKDVEY